MAERPILMSAPMVRAILSGSKSQTRRVVKLPRRTRIDGHYMVETRFSGTPSVRHEVTDWDDDSARTRVIECPYGQPGDLLWVRETWMDLQGAGVEHRDLEGKLQRYAYGADTPSGSYGDEARKDYGLKWRPSIHMPRWASRITLRVTDVRVERLGDISEADAVAEGIERRGPGWAWYTDAKAYTTDPRTSYRDLWESINGPGSWDANPWVWCLTFERVESGNG